MNKITRIQLTGPEIVFWRGTEKIKRFHSERITPASRLRLNDVLAVWSKEHKIEARPYVGTGWLVTNLYVVDVPTVKHNVNAGKIAEDLDRIQGLGGLAKGMLADDTGSLKGVISDARHDLIMLMIALREIEEDSSSENA